MEQLPIELERPKMHGYKIVCLKLGIVMCIYFIFRFLGALGSSLLNEHININPLAHSLLNMVVTVALVYIVPMIATAIAFKQMYHFNPWNPKVSELYKKPKRLAQALGTFPAMYGFGYGIAILTLLAGYLITRATGGGLIEDMLRPTTVGPTTTLSGALIMVFLLVIVAPIFEEIWVRGIMYDALKPYGDGIAILITSIIFGLMHGSINMLFYTTALGFALGYVRYATNSLLLVIILHAIINAIAAGLLFIMTMVELTHEANRLINTVQNVYMLAMLTLIIVGIIAFILKIPTIRKYRIENNWPQVSSGKKTAVFFLSIPVILMLILAINEHTHFWLISLILP